MTKKSMSMQRHLFTVLVTIATLVVFAGNAGAQDRGATRAAVTVRGSDGRPVGGATIWYNEGAALVHTNQSGQARLNLERAGDALRVEAPGYDPLVVSLDSVSRQGDLNVILNKPSYGEGKKDLVRLPFGELESRRIVGAVTQIRPQELLTYDNNTSVLEALRGRVPGLFGTRDIRGLGNAIVVIDGIPRSSQSSGDRLNMVDDLNLQQIQSITVLRDATSCMLYGARAGQGVILITTRHGVPFKRSLHVYAEGGVSNPLAYPSYLSASDYMILYNEALANDGLPAKYSLTDITNTKNHSDAVHYPDEAFYTDRYLKADASFFNVTAEASGGNENTQYYSSLRLDKTGSLLKPQGGGDKSEEYHLNFRGNVNFRLNNWMSAYLDAGAIYNDNTYPNGYYGDGYDGDFFSFASSQLPNAFPILIPSAAVSDSSLLKSARMVDGSYLLGGTNQYGNNILGNLIFGGLQSTRQKSLQFNAGLKFDLGGLLKGLSAHADFTYDFLNSYTLRQNNQYAVYQPSYTKTDAGTDSLVVTRYGQDVKENDQTVNGNYFQRRYGVYGALDYQGDFGGAGVLNATALAYMASLSTGNSTASSAVNSRDQHFGLRANYMLGHRYVAEFDGVYVGSSYLSPQRRYAFSPSAGLGWIISREPFMPRGKVLSYLKLKASYGVLHTDDQFDAYRLYSTDYSRGGNFAYNNASGDGNAVTQIDRIGNPGLGFVREKSFNAGFTSSLFADHVSLEADYFNILLAGEPVIQGNAYPAYLGGFIPMENYNQTRHSGAEAALTYKGRSGGFRYAVNLNMVYAVPRAVRESEVAHAYPYQYRQGRVNDAIFGLVAEGLFKDQAEVDQSPTQTFGSVKPGDIRYKDVNGDGVINTDDEVQIGNAHARFQYGLNLRLGFGRFELFLAGDAQTGGEVFYNNSYYWVYGNEKYSSVVLNRWTPATAATATYPRLTTTSGSNNFRNSTYWLYSANYFSLDRAQLTWHVPAKLFWKGLEVYVRGNNLFMIAPARKQRQLNIGSAPQMSSYAIGLTGSF
jgi:TonB-linked SusC/RagA family outer membrane protein